MKMRRILGSTFSLLIAAAANAQVPEDALKFSSQPPLGTARSTAIGGAIGALGGDISSNYVNPAGLGFYKTSDFVITPGFRFLTDNSNFRGTAGSDKRNSFPLGTSGFVFGGPRANGGKGGRAFAFTISRTANFNENISYSGDNDFSSYSEQFAAELSNSGVAIDNVFDANLSLPTKMAVYTYLIDTFTNANNQLVVMGRPEFLDLLNQQKRIETRGGITEPSFGFASNINDNLYMGISAGIPIVNYRRHSVFTESDATGNTDNNFGFSRYEEDYKTTGIGINIKAGVIVKPIQQLRLGLALHSPSFYALRDQVNSKMVTDVEKLFGPNDPGVDSVNSSYYYGDNGGVFDYSFSTPWRAILSAAYVLHETEDVTQQKGFLTADVEYVNYKSARYTASSNTAGDQPYYDGVNSTVKDYYKSALNLRVGGELKFTTVMARLGFAYYGSPYADNALKGARTFISGGLGYRNKGMFIDLTYRHSLKKDVDFPYRLSDRANTFAELKGTGGNVLLTVGFKFG